MKFVMAAAALAVSTIGANAADLAKKAPAAVDYVKVCDTYGAGFFYIPGSETCLKIGGYARFDVFGGRDDFGGLGTARGDDSIGTAARFRLNFDARSMTTYGLLRGFGQLDFDVDSDGAEGVSIDKAYIQWGGWTAGHASSMFDFFTGEAAAISYGEIVHDDTVNLLAYTFSIGNGVSATLSLEDTTFAGRQDDSGNYGGEKTPDFVAAVKVEQGWGSAQVMGVAHQAYGATAAADAGWGFAVGGGVIVKLPMLGADDEFGIQAAYADKALRYLDFNLGTDGLNAFAVDDFDAAGNGSTGWSMLAGYKHSFSPALVLGLNFGYMDVDQSGIARDFKRWDAAGSLTWTPVTNLDITAAVEYSSIDNKTVADQDGIFYALRVQRSF